MHCTGELTCMTELELQDNRIEYLPMDIGRMTRLKV